jgi:ubiquinone/menaquinone biosynthesis C-methylase UbiE
MICLLDGSKRCTRATAVQQTRRYRAFFCPKVKRSSDNGGMDYDRTAMPAGYVRGRALEAGTLALWLDEMAAILPRRPERIVDLGSGTGRFSAGLAAGYAAQVIGVEPSERMRAQADAAVRDPAVHFRAGRAEAIPVESGWADLVFLSMVFHHIEDRTKAAAEIARVLAPGGCVAIRNASREQGEKIAFAGYFEGIEAIHDVHIPSVAEMIKPFEAEGFRLLGHKILVQETHPDWATFVGRAALRADSLLARLPEEAFDAGMAALRARPKPGPVHDHVDLIVLQAR